MLLLIPLVAFLLYKKYKRYGFSVLRDKLIVPASAKFNLIISFKRNKQKHESPIQAVPLHPIRRIQIGEQITEYQKVHNCSMYYLQFLRGKTLSFTEQQPEGEKSYPIPVEKLESIFDENHTNGYAQFNEQFDVRNTR